MSASAILAQRQALFLSVYLPTISDRLAFRFRSLLSEEKAEAVQDATATAWLRFTRAAEAGIAWDGVAGERVGCATPSGIATFIASHHAMGRRFLGTHVADPLAPACQGQGRAQVRYLNDRTSDMDTDEAVSAALLARSHTNPINQVRIRLDWAAIAARCSQKARQVLALLINGWKTGDIARHLGMSPGRVTQLKGDIAVAATALGYGAP